MNKTITLSADEALIEQAQRRAARENTTLNELFRNMALRKFARSMDVSEVREYLRLILMSLCQYYPSTRFYPPGRLLKLRLATSALSPHKTRPR
jgi:hypothetical protein